ncbi:MAG: nitrate reductase molybdenum cofactor assembly chaperone [Reyranellaceae bacterium]
MMMLYRVLARLLSYPDDGICRALGEMREPVRATSALPANLRASLDGLIADMRAADPLELQEAYVATFDRMRSLSLHLFEHVHGDSRDRGPAMLDLVELYRQHGLDVTARELPDYLPLFLEFLSVLPAEKARQLLRDAGAILAVLHDRLDKRKSPYRHVFAALLHLAQAKAVARDEPVEELDFAALDRAWEEAAVTFGPEGNPALDGGQDCGRASAMVARMNETPGTRR